MGLGKEQTTKCLLETTIGARYRRNSRLKLTTPDLSSRANPQTHLHGTKTVRKKMSNFARASSKKRTGFAQNGRDNVLIELPLRSTTIAGKGTSTHTRCKEHFIGRLGDLLWLLLRDLLALHCFQRGMAYLMRCRTTHKMNQEQTNTDNSTHHFTQKSMEYPRITP